MEWKLRILDYLYEQGRPEEQVADLVRCLDLMMPEPKLIQEEFDNVWLQREERRKMATAYMSNLERKWLKEGVKDGVKEGLEKGVKVGQEEGKLSEGRNAVMDVLDAKSDRAADALAENIKRIDNLALLRALLRSAVTAPSLARPLGIRRTDLLAALGLS